MSGQRIHRSGNRKALIERFELLDQGDKPVRAVLAGSRVRICCVIHFGVNLDNPTIGFLIRDRLGNDVFGTNTFHLKTPTGQFKKDEQVEVSFELDLNIGPGNYSLTLAVHSGASHTEDSYDWCNHLLAFSVIPNWPFSFVGVAALPVAAEVSRQLVRLRRRCGWGQVIDFTERGNAHLYQLEGWSFPEEGYSWTNGQRSELEFELPTTQKSARLTIDAAPYLGAGVDCQEVEVLLGNELVARWQVANSGNYTCEVPARLIQREVRLTLVHSHPHAPASAGESSDIRQLALAVRSVTWHELER
jgi:hypothetical protein